MNDLSDFSQFGEFIVKAKLIGFLVGPSGVHFDFLAYHKNDETVEVFCFGRMLVVDAEGISRLAIDGSDYIDEALCKSISQWCNVSICEWDSNESAAMLGFEGSKKIVFQSIRGQENERPVRFNVWSGKPHASSKILAFAF